MKELKSNKRDSYVLITGATSGIGFELAKEFAKNNFNIIFIARNLDKLIASVEIIKKKYQVEVNYFVCDISNTNEIDKLYNEVKKNNFDVSILINNAGIGYWGNFEKINTARQIELLNLNIIGLTHISRLFVKDMLAKGYGKILNLSSIAAFTPIPYAAVYAASKSYVLAFSEALDYELKDKNIRVSALCPPDVASGFQKGAGYGEYAPKGLFSSTAEKVALETYQQFMNDKTVIRPWKKMAKLLFFMKIFQSRKTEIEIANKIMKKRLHKS